MPSTILRNRHSAYLAQSGLCHYCGFPMWETNLTDFSLSHNIKPSIAKHLQCTAEHLDARKDGGKNSRQNIVAACIYCNLRRHRINKAPNPNAYRQLVRRRVNNGRWHPKAILTMLRSVN
jgi:5-methylcytosine-specific restriction endonuclease McrA